MGAVLYAGPFRRLAGWIVDGTLSVALILSGVLLGARVAGVLGALAGAVTPLWLYFAALESSPRRATLAKLALGMQVTDLEGRRITFARASGRHFAMYLSIVTPFAVGFVMAFWTKRRQALHDYISSTVVVKAR